MKELRFPLIIMLMVAIGMIGMCFWLGIAGLFDIGDVFPPEKDKSDGVLFIGIGIGMIFLTRTLVPVIRRAFQRGA